MVLKAVSRRYEELMWERHTLFRNAEIVLLVLFLLCLPTIVVAHMFGMKCNVAG